MTTQTVTSSQEPVKRFCAGCGVPMVGRRRQALSCSATCRVRRHRTAQLPRSVRLARTWGLEPRDFWRTPPGLIVDLVAELGCCALDAAATAEDAVVARFLSPAEDALQMEWGPVDGWVWANPPYSRKGGGLLAWLHRCIDQAQRWSCIVVMLAPPGVGSRYRAEALGRGVEVRDLPRRLAFIHPDTGQAAAGNREGSSLFIVRPDRLREF